MFHPLINFITNTEGADRKISKEVQFQDLPDGVHHWSSRTFSGTRALMAIELNRLYQQAVSQLEKVQTLLTQILDKKS